jgi:hypothetical protein
MGASLLILANKRDLPNCISLDDIGKVGCFGLVDLGFVAVFDSNSYVEDISLQCYYRRECPGGTVLVGT